MHPALSVILLTTLLGVGQGLFLALYTGQLYSVAKLLERIVFVMGVPTCVMSDEAPEFVGKLLEVVYTQSLKDNYEGLQCAG